MFRTVISRNLRKDPDEVITYQNNWEKNAAVPATAAITASTWTVPTGITMDSDSFDSHNTYYTMSGGTLWETYTLVNHVVLDNGEELDWTVYITIKPS